MMFNPLYFFSPYENDVDSVGPFMITTSTNRRAYTAWHNEDLRGEWGRVTVNPGGHQLVGGPRHWNWFVVRWSYGPEPQPLANGTDLTGNGLPNLLIAQFHGGGSSNSHRRYAYTMFELKNGHAVLIEKRNVEEGEYVDPNGDGLLTFEPY